jgi:hypothetical protein
MHEEGVHFRNRERAAAILHFRNELRQVHKDVRMNTRVCKHSWSIITAVYDRKVNLSLTSMVQRLAPNLKSAASSGKNAKRKKLAQSDDESGNENVQTPPRPSKGKKIKVAAML